MDTNPDLTDLLKNLSDAGVRFLVVGAHAVAFHTEPRYTKDFDIWSEPTAENAAKLWKALRVFGAPLRGIDPGDFADPNIVFQMGVEPYRIDVVMGIDGVEFAAAWANRVPTRYNGVPIYVLSREDLVRNKRAVGRAQDLLDVKHLLSSGRAKRKPKPWKRK